jgi:hypothetical protein
MSLSERGVPMNRVVGFVLVAAVAVLSAVTLAQRTPQAPPAPAAEWGRRWEYASLRFNLMKEKWDWTSPSENLSDDKLRIYRALGGQGRTPGGVSYVDIATQAGQQSWEVISVLQRDTGTEVWFKRPVR